MSLYGTKRNTHAAKRYIYLNEVFDAITISDKSLRTDKIIPWELRSLAGENIGKCSNSKRLLIDPYLTWV